MAVSLSMREAQSSNRKPSPRGSVGLLAAAGEGFLLYCLGLACCNGEMRDAHALNRVKEKVSPYDEDDATYKTVMSYDEVGNLTKVDTPASDGQAVPQRHGV